MNACAFHSSRLVNLRNRICYRLGVLSPRPSAGVIFAITYTCNYNCTHCNLTLRNAKLDEMNSNEIIQIFNASKALRFPVYVTGGEPFLREDLAEIVRCLLGTGHQVAISTNGSIPESVQNLLDTLNGPESRFLSVSVSVDGVGDVNDRIRSKGAFQKAIETIRILKQNKIPVSAATVIQKDNLDCPGEIHQYFKEMGVPVCFSPKIMFSEFQYEAEDIPKIVPFVSGPDVKYLASRTANGLREIAASERAKSAEAQASPEGGWLCL